MPHPRILLTEGLEATPLAWLREHAEVLEAKYSDRGAIRSLLPTLDAMIVRTYTQVDEDLLAGSDVGEPRRLRVVGRAGVGLDNIDQEACARRNIAVLSTPTANTRAVCEYVFNLIFSLGRPIVNCKRPVSPEEFHGYRKKIRGLELAGKTLGILGMGRIGRGVGKIGWAMQMEVIYNDLVDVSGLVDFPARAVSKSELYERADILTIHVNHQPEDLNYHLIDLAVLSRMKHSALLINTSRGEVVDAQALATALKTHRIAGAALDVHEPEPPPADYPLWDPALADSPTPLILAPHLAARTQGAMDRMSWVARDVVEHLGGALERM